MKFAVLSGKVAALRSDGYSFVLMLSLSIISLFIGPVLYYWLRQGGFVARTLDSLIIAVLVALMVVWLIPESWSMLGYWSVVLMLAGYLVPGLLEILIKKAAHSLHLISLALALLGLALHAVLDGAGLAGSEVQTPENLALAIVVHRLSVGLMLWMMVQPVFGKRAAFGVLGFVALATIGGYFLSETFLVLEGDEVMSVIQALIIGAIVHSLIHRSHGTAEK